MPDHAPGATIGDVAGNDPAEVLVLDEFRLHAADTDGAAARIVSAASKGDRDPVPLLTSIDDPRDVATLRTLRAEGPEGDGPSGEAALGPLVATWQTAKRYRARIAARSQGPPASSFRLAVTESGINDERVAQPGTWIGAPMAGDTLALLLIGVPEGRHAGLLVLVGRDTADLVERGLDGKDWALPLSRDLGVRLYASDG
jgi:hypothetical protein